MFQKIDVKQSFPLLEQSIETWWRDRGIIARALAHGDRARPFVFFEGPPTANGRPGIHHMEARTSKDVIMRYRRMRGQMVIGARAGWDTHGLPVELEVERQLGLNGKPEIETYGIAAFNALCKESVWTYVQEWEYLTARIAFWIDLDHPYITYENPYIESLWWILKRFWEQGLLFRDHKVTMHCPRCGTSLSDHEVSQGFVDGVDDPCIWVRFLHRTSSHALDEQLAGAAFLVWTTTPWTLPANVALAVKPAASYLLVASTAGSHTERLILGAPLAEQVLGADNFTVLATFAGHDLCDLRYEQLFHGVPGSGEQVDLSAAYRVVTDDMVSLEDGSGIVHIAPAYGDLEVGRAHGLPTLFSVDLAGLTLPAFQAEGFGGLFFKQADPLITRNLQERQLLWRAERIRHSYPFCWRCSTPLLYYARPSWYIRTTARREQLLKNNALIDWVPGHIKEGRFGNWLEQNVNWALSRERYWGTPLPIWICDVCERVTVIGSVADLSAHAGRDLRQLDLHRPQVDEIVWACPDCQRGTCRRIPDVADCWFDSGAMPIAQWHYPFENQALFEQAGQADFITEAIDQTRGWFYTLHAISTLLFDRPAYKHVICLGHILDEQGEKMSKSRGNVVDPWQVLATCGADAIRWFMCASAPPYNPRTFSLSLVAQMQHRVLLPLWHTCAFFVTYANIDGWQPPVAGRDPWEGVELQVLDRWVLARLNVLVDKVTTLLEQYDLFGPTRAIEQFLAVLTNWYVRRTRRRFWKSEHDIEKQAAYLSLYTCVTTLIRLVAPFTPYISEALYQNLVVGQQADAPVSVHLADYPVAQPLWIDQQLLTDMELLIDIVRLGRAARQNAGLRVRQPLGELLVRVTRQQGSATDLRRFESELCEELNVKAVRFLSGDDDLVDYAFKPNLPVLGKRQSRLIPLIRRALSELQGEDAARAASLLASGQPIELLPDGNLICLQPDEVLILATAPAGYAVAREDDLVVALSTALTSELLQEGLARDLVRQIQDARRSAGLAITDQIALVVQVHAGLTLEPLLAAYGAYIRAETQASTLTCGPLPTGFFAVEIELDGERATIGLQRQGKAGTGPGV
ncbi:MAG TPA: isoleucine--tRNA ligase [Ktedonobacteraceae bacterium]|jgi:isoleucyl-tRNA synthetase